MMAYCRYCLCPLLSSVRLWEDFAALTECSLACHSFISLPVKAHYLSVDYRLLRPMGIAYAKRCKLCKVCDGILPFSLILRNATAVISLRMPYHCPQKHLWERLWSRETYKHFCTDERRQASLVIILLCCAPKCSNEVHSVYWWLCNYIILLFQFETTLIGRTHVQISPHLAIASVFCQSCSSKCIDPNLWAYLWVFRGSEVAANKYQSPAPSLLLQSLQLTLFFAKLQASFNTAWYKCCYSLTSLDVTPKCGPGSSRVI